MSASVVIHDARWHEQKGVNVRESYEELVELVNATPTGRLIQLTRDSGLRIAIRQDQIVQIAERRDKEDA